MSAPVRCRACGGDTVRDVRPDEVEHKGQAMTFDLSGWYCTSGDEVVLDGPDAAVANEAFVNLRRGASSTRPMPAPCRSRASGSGP